MPSQFECKADLQAVEVIISLGHLSTIDWNEVFTCCIRTITNNTIETSQAFDQQPQLHHIDRILADPPSLPVQQHPGRWSDNDDHMRPECWGRVWSLNLSVAWYPSIALTQFKIHNYFCGICGSSQKTFQLLEQAWGTKQAEQMGVMSEWKPHLCKLTLLLQSTA